MSRGRVERARILSLGAFEDGRGRYSERKMVLRSTSVKSIFFSHQLRLSAFYLSTEVSYIGLSSIALCVNSVMCTPMIKRQ